MILDGVLKEGDPLPSVRNVAAGIPGQSSHRAQGVSGIGRRAVGRGAAWAGMFVNAGARDLLLKGERAKFLAEEWPRVAATIERLGLTPKELEGGGEKTDLPPVTAATPTRRYRRLTRRRSKVWQLSKHADCARRSAPPRRWTY